jgi:hypothetical protein
LKRAALHDPSVESVEENVSVDPNLAAPRLRFIPRNGIADTNEFRHIPLRR